ncbi:hypothetical protein PR048_014259, partial [Dryococelus australis]
MFLNTYHINLPYKVYWSIIIQEFNIKLKFPRSETCSICDTFALKINNPEKKLEIEKKVHLLKAESFRKKKKKFRRQARAGNIVCSSFDYMENLPLLNLKTNASSTVVFGVHDLGSDRVTMFTYHEGDGRKGSNKVTSTLLTYINNNNEPLDNLVLISDSCCVQNKNQTMVHFLCTLVHCFHAFKTVTIKLH